MKRYRLIWYVWISFPDQLSPEQWSDYVEYVTASCNSKHTLSASFKTFHSIKHAEKFAIKLANKFKCDIDVINNRQRKKWKKTGRYTGYVVSP